MRKVFETGLFGKGVRNWSVWEGCLKLVSFGRCLELLIFCKVFGSGQFVKRVLNLSFCKWYLKLVSFRKTFETGQFAKGI